MSSPTRRRTDRPAERFQRWHRVAFVVIASAAVYAVLFLTAWHS